MFDWILNLIKTYPEIFAGAVGIIVAITLTEVARLVYFPKDWDNTDQWRAILPVDFFASFAITHALWRFLDSADAPGLKVVGSLCFAVACLGLHVFGLRFALHRWPWIASVDPNAPASGKTP